MEVSVIIPVYNAEKYVALAIDSVLMQDEVKEVVIIADGSTDRSFAICQYYALRDKRIILIQHPDRLNHGAGASFNLGIRNARCPYVAFLGADDQYLPGRFNTACTIFSEHPDAHGAYAHIGVVYYEPEYKALHLKRVPREISGLHEKAQPKELLARLLRGNQGHISLDALVVKREILTHEFLFDESLRQGQDTDFMFRLASRYRLYGPAQTTIVALRGVHSENRVFKFDEATHYKRQLLLKCIRSRFYGCNEKVIAKSVINRYLKGSRIFRLLPLLDRHKQEFVFMLFLCVHPRVAINYLLLK